MLYRLCLDPPRLSPRSAWLLALLLPGGTAAVQALVLPGLTIAPFVLLFLSVTLSAWLGGRGPGLLAVLPAALLGNYLFIPPHDAWNLSGPGLLATLLFVPTAAAIALLTGSLRAALGEQREAWREAERAAAQVRRLQAVTAGLAAALRPEDVARVVAEHAGTALGAQRCTVSVRVGDRLELVGAEGYPAGALDRWRVYALDASTPNGLAALTAEPVWVASQAELGERFPALAEVAASLGLGSLASLPLLVAGRCVGVLALGFGAARTLDAEQRSLACGLAQQAGQVLERARLLAAEEEARERLEQLLAVATACSAALTPAEVARAVFEEALGRLGGSAVNICTPVDAASLRVEYALGIPAEELATYPLEPLDGLYPASEAARSRAPVYAESGAELDTRFPAFAALRRRLSAEAIASLPLVVGEEVVGVLGFAFPAPRRFTAAERTFLGALAGQCALALARARSFLALREEGQRKDAFLAMLSHELRNPLTPVQNSLAILQRAPAGSELAGRALAIAARQTKHLTRLVNDLLDHSRIARGTVQLESQRLELGALVQCVVEDHLPGFEAAGLTLTLDPAAGPLWVEGDDTRLAQVAGNLLQNAIKFTPAGGSATVSLAAQAGQAVLRVRDTGEGIAPELLGRLFEPFQQADASLARTRGGLGLGLSVARTLVTLHGGTITARSEGQGRGSELVVGLPLVVVPAPVPGIPASARPEGSRARRRVLIIEDVRDAAESLREALSHHEVELALTGGEGLEKARALRPEVILCDLGLPDLDGYAVARALRADATLAGTLLIALTGYALAGDRRRSAEAGFDHHLAKPPDLEALERLLTPDPLRGVKAGG